MTITIKKGAMIITMMMMMTILNENSHAPEAGCTSESKWRDFLNEVSLKSPAHQ